MSPEALDDALALASKVGYAPIATAGTSRA